METDARDDHGVDLNGERRNVAVDCARRARFKISAGDFELKQAKDVGHSMPKIGFK